MLKDENKMHARLEMIKKNGSNTRWGMQQHSWGMFREAAEKGNWALLDFEVGLEAEPSQFVRYWVGSWACYIRDLGR